MRRDPQNPIVTLKTTSRADYVFARLEARREGADDALFLTLSGHLSEATTANIFLVRRAADGVTELATPSLDCAILPGTTRSWLLRWADGAGLRAVEAWLTPDDLAAADEAFMCSSVAGVLPVTRFDGRADRRRHARPVDAPRPRRPRALHRRRLSAGSVAGGGPGRPGELRQARGSSRTPRRAAPGGARGSPAASRSSPIASRSAGSPCGNASQNAHPSASARSRSSAAASSAQLPSNE